MFITIENRTMHNKVQYDNMQEKGIWQNVGSPFSYVKKDAIDKYYHVSVF